MEGPGRRGLYSISSGWAATLGYLSVGTACKDAIIYQVLACVLWSMYFGRKNTNGSGTLDINFIRTRRCDLVNTTQVHFLRYVLTVTNLQGLNSRIEAVTCRSNRQSVIVGRCVKIIR